MALILIFFFAYLIPLFPLAGTGAYFEGFNIETIVNIIKGATLPALSIIIVSMLGWWFLSSRILTLNTLSEDFIEYAVIRGLPWKHIFRRYLMKNILLPQVTALGLALGSIFSGAILTEVVFAYPGLGLLLYRAIANGDISTVMSPRTIITTHTFILIHQNNPITFSFIRSTCWANSHTSSIFTMHT
jgi:peptide/nickel transport system permease protein